jgi:ERF superfamily
MTFEVQKISMPVNAATPMEMLNRAMMSGAAPEILERLLALQERWEHNQASKAFDEAIAAARAEIPPIKRNKTVSYGAGKAAYNHEDLAEIERTILPILSKYGISYRFRTKVADKQIIVTCILSKGGYREENSLPGPADTSGSKNPIQQIGSTVTYLERYALKAALGLSATDDDDGVGANQDKLTDEQVAELTKAIEDSGRDVAWFCNFAAKINSITDLAPERYEAALQHVRKLPKKVTNAPTE